MKWNETQQTRLKQHGYDSKQTKMKKQKQFWGKDSEETNLITNKSEERNKIWINEYDVNVNLKKPISADKPDKSHQTSITCSNLEESEQTNWKKQIWRHESGEPKLKKWIVHQTNMNERSEETNLNKWICRNESYKTSLKQHGHESEQTNLQKQISSNDWRHKSEEMKCKEYEETNLSKGACSNEYQQTNMSKQIWRKLSEKRIWRNGKKRILTNKSKEMNTNRRIWRNEYEEADQQIWWIWTKKLIWEIWKMKEIWRNKRI